MKFTKLHVAILTFVLFITVRVGLGAFVPPTTCRDGWESPSIGHRGACSWHGGVADNGWAFLATIASVGVAVGAFFVLAAPIERREAEELRKELETRQRLQKEYEERREIESRPVRALAKKFGMDCPTCGHPMKIRLARRGRNAGGHFLGCTCYPRCHGIRPVQKADLKARRATEASFLAELEKMKSGPMKNEDNTDTLDIADMS